MGRPSQLLSDRYQLQLCESWQNWFDGVSHQMPLPGFFRLPVDLDGLCEKANQRRFGRALCYPIPFPS